MEYFIIIIVPQRGTIKHVTPSLHEIALHVFLQYVCESNAHTKELFTSVTTKNAHRYIHLSNTAKSSVQYRINGAKAKGVYLSTRNQKKFYVHVTRTKLTFVRFALASKTRNIAFLRKAFSNISSRHHFYKCGVSLKS